MIAAAPTVRHDNLPDHKYIAFPHPPPVPNNNNSKVVQGGVQVEQELGWCQALGKL